MLEYDKDNTREYYDIKIFNIEKKTVQDLYPLQYIRKKEISYKRYYNNDKQRMLSIVFILCYYIFV